MKITYIFHGRFPSEKAASLFSAKSAESFAELGHTVELLVPTRKSLNEDPFEYYRVKRNFVVKRLFTIDLFPLPLLKKIAFYVSFVVFSISCLFYFSQKRDALVISNEWLPLLLVSLVNKNTVYEVHDFPNRFHSVFTLFFKRVGRIIATNTWKKETLIQEFGIPSEKILVERNAVDLKDFDIPLLKEEARREIGIGEDSKIVLYTGHLYSWKGVDTLAEAASFLPEHLFYFVGGTEKDITAFKERWCSLSNIRIIGYRPHEEIPIWLKAADVLVLPNTAKEEISYQYTSPMKLYEYMASGVPIIASDIPSVREVVGKDEVTLVSPDDVRVLSEAICMLSDRYFDVQTRAHNAFKKVHHFTWNNRAKRIVAFLSR